jgi:hypothetical protein
LVLAGRSWGRPRLAAILAGLGLFALALQTKEMAVTLPAVWGLGAWLQARRRAAESQAVAAGPAALPPAPAPGRRRVWLWTGLALGALAAAFVVFRGVVESRSHLSSALWGGSPLTHVATAVMIQARYLGLWLWPDPLIGDYHPFTIRLAEGLGDPRVWLGLACWAGVWVGAVWALRRRVWTTAFGLGWYGITILPVSQIFPHHELFAEHYLYLPSLGLVLALLPLGEALARRLRPALGVVLAVLALVLVGRTGLRAADYVSEEHFYRVVLAHAPENVRAQYTLGVLEAERGHCAEARGLLVEPMVQGSARQLMGAESRRAWLWCALLDGQRQRVPEVLAELGAARPDEATVRLWQGLLALEAGRPQQALPELESAVAASAGEPIAVGLLARAYNAAGRPQEALRILAQHPHGDQLQCEEGVRAGLQQGTPAALQAAWERLRSCADGYPQSVALWEARVVLNLAAGREVEAAAAEDRLRALGAPAAVFERIESFRQRLSP